MKRFLKLLAVLALLTAALNLHRTERTLRTLEQGVIRLHILADSDSLEDQTKKLRVRDALLEASSEWLTGCEGAGECYAVLTEKLPRIEQTAAAVLREDGCSDGVRATLGTAEFPARRYGRVTLPAGRYRSLTVQIGSGEGQNWWCVMYPGLCLPAAGEAQLRELAEELPAEACEMAEEPERYEIRLKCIEVLRAIGEWVEEKCGTQAPHRPVTPDSCPDL